jgi:chromosome segregation ATPase
LEQTRLTETEAVADFARLKGAKTRELTAVRANLDARTQELATTEESLAADKQNLADTEVTLAADSKALLGVKQQCSDGDAEFEARRKSRSEELQAVAECKRLLSSDEVSSALVPGTNSTNGTVSFLQVTASRTEKAIAALEAKSSSRVRRMAVRVKLDSFDKVKESVDAMIAQLKKEQEDDQQHKDLCDADTKENEEQLESTEAAIKEQTTEQDSLVATLEELETDLDDLQAELNETKAQMAAAGGDREAANAEYQMTIANQHAAQNVLQLALHKMQLVYLQQTPPDMGDYAPNEKGGGVIGMIQSIIDDSKA